MRQVPVRAVKMVSQIRAAFATLFPARAEHEVIDDQLTMTLEEFGQHLFSVRSFEGILLLDLDHREFASRCRVNSFSRVSKSFRATNHSASDTTSVCLSATFISSPSDLVCLMFSVD